MATEKDDRERLPVLALFGRAAAVFRFPLSGREQT